jgi:hypothetical protein
MNLSRVCAGVTLVAAACAMPRDGSPSGSSSSATSELTSEVTPASTSVTTFATPREAMDALLASADDPAHADALLGPGGSDVLCNCDADDDDDLAEVRGKMEEQVQFTDDGPDVKHVLLGNDEWELPLPLVRAGDRWHFDVQAGKDELLSRSIGFNELHAIATLRALVDAQDEFDATTRDGDQPTYAQKFSSTPGHQDGLHWESGDQQPQSPLGPRLCGATADGSDPCESAPTTGYCFRIVKAQGAHACGGAKSYVGADGRLSAGFAFVAWPSDYGTTGVMTFQVNQLGLVFQKDLGEKTSETAQQLAAFDPDASWEPVRD